MNESTRSDARKTTLALLLATFGLPVGILAGSGLSIVLTIVAITWGSVQAVSHTRKSAATC